MTTDSIGIDISKDMLDVHRLSTGGAARFANSPAGLRKLRRWVGDTMPDLVVYEPTGIHHRALEEQFSEVLPLVRVNPLHARHFAKARGTRAKTDAVDARVLALMGPGLGLIPDRPGDKDHPDLKELHAARIALVKERTRERNRLKNQSLEPLALTGIRSIGSSLLISHVRGAQNRYPLLRNMR